ncbi:MAG: TIGR02757 family protein [Bdellovibrionales bacterium GWB1_55_8]|nr:MAG: TIGR02757 family protein [Bdellovibrionales bacterium GWB1_55_8]
MFLNQLHGTYHSPRYLESDPLEFVHRYSDPWDQEAVGLIAALLAYGRVAQIRRSVSDALSRMETAAGTPSAFVRGLPARHAEAGWRTTFEGWTHRFNRGGDLEVLLLLLADSWREHGSLGARFTRDLAPTATDFGPALDSLIGEWRGKSKALRPHQPTGSFDYFLTAPSGGSCCKRWCMFLRWMGRKDEIDPGLWTENGVLQKTFSPGRFLSPKQLVIPIDTHTGRLSSYLGLTARRTLDWKAAREVTEALRTCNPSDPVMYDFSLARLGILEVCTRTYRAEICGDCPLLPACRFARNGALS